MKKVFLTIAILITPMVANAACTAAPDCAGLGYTKTAADCPDGGIKCPFDSTKMFCPKIERKCAVGDIVYSDMSCDPTRVTGKTPIGVVSQIIGRHYIAMSLAYASFGLGKGQWSPDSVDIPDIPNYNSMKGIGEVTSLEGKANTGAWGAYYGADPNYAPGYCYAFSTEGTKQGDWYLPSVGELYVVIMTNSGKLNAGLSLAGGSSFVVGSGSGAQYWTSSEVNSSNAVVISGSDGSFSYVTKNAKYNTRCSFAFE